MARTAANPHILFFSSPFSSSVCYIRSVLGEGWRTSAFLYKRRRLNSYYADLQKPQSMYARLLCLAVFCCTYNQYGMVFGGRKKRVAVCSPLLHSTPGCAQLSFARMSPRRQDFSSGLHLVWLQKSIPNSVPCTWTKRKKKKYFGMTFWLKTAQLLKCGRTIWKVI